MRYFICFCFIACAQLAQAQLRDSILLESVTVFGLPEEKYLSGSTLSETDSILKSHYASSHLGERLSLEFPIYFRNYGNGMISGISMRGTSPQHTAVLWNGVNINSFSLGQMDFSLLPSVAFETVKVHQGAGSARFGSGAIGGSILLDSEIPESKYIRLSQEFGSFGRYFTELSGAFSKERFSFQTKVYNQQSENDFLIHETGDRQDHASFTQRGLSQDVSYAFKHAAKLSLHYWYHYSDRKIQPPLNQSESANEQVDKNHRVLLSYESNSKRGSLKFSSGFFRDVIIYNGGPSTISRWTAKASDLVSITKTLKAEFAGEANLIKGKLDEYEGGLANDNRFDLSAAVYYNPLSNLEFSFNLRQPFITGFTSPILPYVGIEYSLFEKRLTLLGNASKNFRAPTLNDRFWQNAGDRNLLPEKSNSLEVGAKTEMKFINVTCTYFRQRIDQWIFWEPKAGGIFVPNNLAQVDVEGTQVNISFKHKLNKVHISADVNGQLSKSINTETSPMKRHTLGKQLMYSPQRTGSGTLQVHFRNFRLIGSAQLVGERFTTPANDALYMLPPETLFNLSLSGNWQVQQSRVDAILQCNNLTNEEYQFYAGRAMPGRSYAIKIVYQINFKTKHDHKN